MWCVVYDDGSSLEQFNPDGSENLFKNIDQDKLAKFIVSTRQKEVIVNIGTGEVKVNGTKISFGYDDLKHRLIYFRRVRQALGSGSESSITEYVGWQSTIQGSNGPNNIKRIVGIMEDKITIQCE